MLPILILFIALAATFAAASLVDHKAETEAQSRRNLIRELRRQPHDDQEGMTGE